MKPRNGENDDDDADADAATIAERSAWPTRKEAAARRNCSLTTIHTLERKGVLHARNVNGVWRIDPRELNAAEINVDSAVEMGVADLLKEAANMMRQAQVHAEQCMQLVVAPMKGLQEGWNTLNGALITRLGSVEAAIDVMRKTNEEALSLQHERLLDERRFDANEKRKTQAFETVLKQVPDIAKAGINAIMRAAGGTPIPDPLTPTPSPDGTSTPPAPTPNAGAPPPSPAPPAASSSSPRVEAPPEAQSDDVEEQSAVDVLNRISNLSDEQIAQMAAFGLITKKEAESFRIYRANIRRAQMETNDAKDAAATVVDGELVEDPEPL